MVVWLYTLVSVVIVSLVSMVGLLIISVKEEDLARMLSGLVSFSVGGFLATLLCT